MNSKQKKVNLFWIISMLIMWVNGIVLFNKGRKLKINLWTICGIIVTLLNFLTPPICMTTSNDILMVVLTLLWFISPIAAFFTVISKRKEYIEKMSMINFAKANGLQYKNIDELTENYNKYLGKENKTETEKWEDFAKKQNDATEQVESKPQTDCIEAEEKEQVVEPIQERDSDAHMEEKSSKLEDRLKKLK